MPEPRRADARRNIERILAAALELYGSRPGVSMSDVAKAAGVGRVTLYAHFPSRADLGAAVAERAVAETVAALSGLGLDALPADEAVAAMLRGQWRIFERNEYLRGNIVADVEPERLRAGHDPLMEYLTALLARGRAEGVFRGDLPTGWLITAFYHLVHAAADEQRAGRLTPAEAVEALVATVLSVLRNSAVGQRD
ncbi:TetR family transcriptional regulator [Actinorhabdospora filicis]|uniref:TetR family transcriptional regulator n=1 Tax=Actinorhabdospora filicis TaxID=1785913 RepID=A0A9W6SSV3_9ACTN|nr:TetR/AcrR family transcriptional regulator [Actinorhabdospora filicis]GLZ81448.1 TetR family transcriptional regulator [Actinorhabdospora filicis]